jgi:gluconolactonase
MTDLDVLADGLCFPEGPIACDDGSVVVGEIVGRRLTKISPDPNRLAAPYDSSQ